MSVCWKLSVLWSNKILSKIFAQFYRHRKNNTIRSVCECVFDIDFIFTFLFLQNEVISTNIIPISTAHTFGRNERKLILKIDHIKTMKWINSNQNATVFCASFCCVKYYVLSHFLVFCSERKKNVENRKYALEWNDYVEYEIRAKYLYQPYAVSHSVWATFNGHTNTHLI